MEYNEFLLIINIVTIVILLMMGMLLCSASKFKGECSYAILIIVLTSIPTYIYNVFHYIDLENFATFLAPLAYSANLTLMPLLYFLVRRGFDSFYSFKPIYLLHFLPAVSMFIFSSIYLTYSDSITNGSVWQSNILSNINYICLLFLFPCYIFIIFRYMRRIKRYIRDNFSDSDLLHKLWIPRFILLFSILFILSLITYFFYPKVFAFANQILNIIVVYYLLYSELSFAFYTRYHKVKDTEVIRSKSKSSASIEKEIDVEQLRKYAQEIEDYLASSEAYINPNLSLNELANTMGISSKNLSKAINTILNRNFFNLINSYRIEKSKYLLVSKKEMGLTLDTIAEKCGFNSRFTLNAAFKKETGLTTSEWLKKQEK